MKKNQEKKEKRVLARLVADQLKDEALKSVAGGCTGSTCTIGGDSDFIF